MAAKSFPIHCAHREVVPIAEVKPNPKNPNEHSAKQLKQLAKILRRHGWRSPITISKRSGLVVRGHGRLAAAALIHLTHIPIDYQDYESESAEIEDLIADNKAREGASMDWGAFESVIELVPADLHEATGWNPEELAAEVGGDQLNKNKNKELFEGPRPRLVQYDTTPEQAKVIHKVLGLVQMGLGISNGRALELVCADYLAS